MARRRSRWPRFNEQPLLNTLHLAVQSAAEAGHNALTSDIGDDPQRLAALLLETTSLATNLRRVSAAAIQESLTATAPAVPDEVRWLVNVRISVPQHVR